MENELKKPVSFRPSDYDATMFAKIQQENPYITNVSDLIRLALHRYGVEQQKLKELEERIAKLESSQK